MNENLLPSSIDVLAQCLILFFLERQLTGKSCQCIPSSHNNLLTLSSSTIFEMFKRSILTLVNNICEQCFTTRRQRKPFWGKSWRWNWRGSKTILNPKVVQAVKNLQAPFNGAANEILYQAAYEKNEKTINIFWVI